MATVIDFADAKGSRQLRDRLQKGIHSLVNVTFGIQLRSQLTQSVPPFLMLRGLRNWGGACSGLDANMIGLEGEERNRLKNQIEFGLESDLDLFYSHEVLASGRMFDGSCYRELARAWETEKDPPRLSRPVEGHKKAAQAAEDALRRAVASSWDTSQASRGGLLVLVGAMLIFLGLQPLGAWDSFISRWVGVISSAWHTAIAVLILLILIAGVSAVCLGVGLLIRASPMLRGARISRARDRLMHSMEGWVAGYVSNTAQSLYQELQSSLTDTLATRESSRREQAEAYKSKHLEDAKLRQFDRAIKQNPLYQGASPTESRVGARSLLGGGEWGTLLSDVWTGDPLRDFCRAASQDEALAHRLAQASAELAREMFRGWIIGRLQEDDRLKSGLPTIFDMGLRDESDRTKRAREIGELAEPRVKLRPDVSRTATLIISEPAGGNEDAVQALRARIQALLQPDEFVATGWANRIVAARITEEWLTAVEVVDTRDATSRRLRSRLDDIKKQLPSPQALDLVTQQEVLEQLFPRLSAGAQEVSTLLSELERGERDRLT